MPALLEIEAEFQLPDAGVRIFNSHWESPHVDDTFSGERHLLAMYLARVGPVEGRYCDKSATNYTSLGSLFFRPAHRRLHVRGESVSQQIRGIHCSLDDRWLQIFGSGVEAWSSEELQAALNIRERHIRPYFLRILSEAIDPGFASSTVVEASLIMLTGGILSYLAPSKASGLSRPRQDVVKIVRERVYDFQEIMPTVRELAELSRVSERHLLRLFKEDQGVSVVEFIRKARVERAIELVRDTNLPLKIVAHRLGYSGHAAFTAAFTKEIGTSPSAFRCSRLKH